VNVKTRTLLRIAIVVAVAGYFAYNQFGASGGAHKHTAAPIATHAKSFTLGTLQFNACELPQKKSGATTSAFCAPFSVPENRAAPDGRTLDLRLALIKSDAAAADSDIVVYLAGGPGQSAVDTWPRIRGALAPLRRHHHILLLDQRGTGQSNPLLCPGKSADEDASTSSVGEGFDPAQMRTLTQTCLAAVEKKADPRFYTTTEAVADLEAVRQALGAPLFDLVGVSYGTRMAQQFAMRHPDGVRSIVLDSVAPNAMVLGEDFAINLEDALKAQFARCVQTPECTQAFGDPYAGLVKLRTDLREHPRDAQLRDPVTFQPLTRRLDDRLVAGLVRMFAYTPETAALLPLSISEGLHGNYTPLLGQTQVIAGDMSDLAQNGMQMSVICSEDADLLVPRPQDAQLVLGTAMIDSLRAACEVWPRGTRPDDFHAPLKTDTPVLVLEGEFDPVTPPRYGEEVMKTLGNAKLLVAKGQGHNVIGRGCIPKLVEEFVDKLAPRTLDTKCADVLGPMPAFIDFNGSSP
jgi:pimeloyl-ACP methyl ester carboxylesterase